MIALWIKSTANLIDIFILDLKVELRLGFFSLHVELQLRQPAGLFYNAGNML